MEAEMRMLGLTISGLAMAIGFIWILQGAGWLGGSFMTGDPKWLWIGLATAAAGCIGYARFARRRG